jgi:outer membrane protein TolC
MKTKIILSFLLIAASLSAMSLDETLKEALLHNNSLKKVILNKEEAQHNKDSKKAQNFGRFDLNVNYDHYNNARTLAPLTPMDIVSSPTGAYEMPTTNDLISAGVAYNVVLFDGFAKQKSYQISDLAYKNATLKIKLSKEELIYNVRSLYLSLLSLQEQLKAQEKYVNSQYKLYTYVLKEYELGSKSKLDTLEAKNSYVGARSNKEKIEANIDILKASLSMMIGSNKFDKAEDIPVSFDENARQTLDIENLSRFKLAEFSKSIAEKKLESAEASYYPKIDLSTYYGYSMGPNATTNTYPATGVTYLQKGDFNSENIWQIGLHLKWNIYDFGVKSASVQKEKIALLKSKIDIDDVKLELEKNLKIAKSKLLLAKSDYQSLKSQYNLLAEIQKAQKVKYENSALTLTDLLDTEAKEAITYAKMINAKYEYQKAKYYIEYLLEKGEK